MSESQGHSPRNFYNVPPLSAIVHGSKLISFEDGFFLPSSCHGRTWLLDDFQETCSETTSCKVPNCKQELGTEQSCMQSACLPRVFQTTCSSSRPCEKTICQSGRSSAMLACVSQLYQSGSSQKVIVQNCQPVSHVAKSCPPKTYLSKSCQTLECDPGQCQSQSPESGSCRPPVYVAPGPQLLESSSNTYEPTCCVTGGLQLPSK